MRAAISRRPLLVPVLVAVLAATSGVPAQQGGTVRVIEITAERFEFWPSRITVAEGEEVELRITSDDTMHGFRIVGAGTNVLVPKRGKGYASARFTGTRPGRFTFECSRLCGAGHNFMRGELVVRAASPGDPQ